LRSWNGWGSLSAGEIGIWIAALLYSASEHRDSVIEVLNALVADADSCDLLLPLPGTAIKHRTSIYVDDLVMFLLPILDLFTGASGLITNVDKCSIMPIRWYAVELDHVELSEWLIMWSCWSG